MDAFKSGVFLHAIDLSDIARVTSGLFRELFLAEPELEPVIADSFSDNQNNFVHFIRPFP